MSGPASISQPANLPDLLREHRERIRALEAPSPGGWVYVVNNLGTVAPATTPPDFIPGNALAVPFRNSWGNVLGSQAVSFRIHPATRVALRGAITGGTIPSIIFTLPAGFRPSLVHPVIFPSTDGVSIYTGRVDPNGDVWILATK